VIWALLAACATAPDTGGDTSVCADTPALTWDDFGQGFLRESCEPCHASGALDRHGAPEDVVFDTEDDAIRWATQILSVATGDTPTMPPEGGPTDDQRWELWVWLTCDPPESEGVP
jgi:uncharacterized membrane protein